MSTKPPKPHEPMEVLVANQHDRDKAFPLLDKTAAQAGDVTAMALLNTMTGTGTPERIKRTMNKTATEYNASADEFEKATLRMARALDAMVAAEQDASKRAKASIANAKDVSNQLGEALARVNRILGTDFEQRLSQLERMTDALARLTELERDGTLAPVIAALGGGK